MQLKIISAAIAGTLLAITSANSATVIGTSDLLDSAGLAQMESWLTGDSSLNYSGPLGFTNIFDKASGDTSTDFHNAADGMGATFFVAEMTYGSVKHLIGGYNPQSWHSYSYWNVTPNTADRTAFLFDLTTGARRHQINGFYGEYQTYGTSSYGPTFGAGHDLHIRTDLSDGYMLSISYCDSANTGSHCRNEIGFFGSANHPVTIGQLEVFTISEISAVPVPAALPLFGSALAVLGFMGWRRKRKNPPA